MYSLLQLYYDGKKGRILCGIVIGAVALHAGERQSVQEAALTLLMGIVVLLTLECSCLLEENRRQKRRIEELRCCSEQDALTGLKNRYAFSHIAREMEMRAEGMTVLVCDIDGLKRVNDTFGHLAGDRLIRQAAQILRQSCTERAEIFRMGGDEFIVLFAGAMSVSEILALKKQLEAAGQRLQEEERTAPTLSVGVASGRGEKLLTVIKRADQAMYASRKKERRGFSNFQYAIIEAEKECK